MEMESDESSKLWRQCVKGVGWTRGVEKVRLTSLLPDQMRWEYLGNLKQTHAQYGFDCLQPFCSALYH
jgi:hypothetical protein